MIKWLKNLFKKKEQPVASFSWEDVCICYADDSERKRNYYNVRDEKGRFTKLKGKKNG